MRIALVTACVASLAACQSRPAPAVARSQDVAARDSAFTRLCATAPDSTGGCPLRDQGRRIGPKQIP